MKKIIAISSLAALMGMSANATISRTRALGNMETDLEGNYWFDDSRDIFLNPAMMHKYADSVILEWGGNGQDLTANSDSEVSLNTDGDPKAQGGFLKKSGNYVYGVYLGNESNTSAQLRALASSQAAIAQGLAAGTNGGELLQSADNQIDLFFGWGSDLKYGVSFLYTKDDRSTQNEEDEAMAIRFGVDADKWDAHLNLSLKSQSKETVSLSNLTGVTTSTIEQEFDGKLGLQVGGSYELNNGSRLWAFYKTFKWDQNDGFDYSNATNQTVLDTVDTNVNTAAGKTVLSGSKNRGKQGTTEGDFTTIQLGWGQVIESGKGKLFTSVYLEQLTIEVKGAQTAEVENLTLPVTIGYEAKATEWLTLRGSVVHNIYGQRDNKNYTALNTVGNSLAVAGYGAEGEGSLENSTNVNAGATLTFGKLNIDGFIGTTAFSRTGSAGEQGVLSTDNLMTRVAMTYNF